MAIRTPVLGFSAAGASPTRFSAVGNATDEVAAEKIVADLLELTEQRNPGLYVLRAGEQERQRY
jgi:hypothetical protein